MNFRKILRITGAITCILVSGFCLFILGVYIYMTIEHGVPQLTRFSKRFFFFSFPFIAGIFAYGAGSLALRLLRKPVAKSGMLDEDLLIK